MSTFLPRWIASLPRPGRRLSVALALLAITSLVAVFASCSARQRNHEREQASRTVAVVRQNVVIEVSAAGTIQPLTPINISPKEAGRITALSVDWTWTSTSSSCWRCLLLIAAELVVHQRMRTLAIAFRERDLIPEAAVARLDGAVASAYRLRNSVTAEVLLLAFVYVVGVTLLWRQYTVLDAATWYATPPSDGSSRTLAGVWYGYVSLPIFQFLLCRWYFRILIWTRLLWQVSRIELRLVPTHPDRVGGLGFLAATSHAFIPLLMAHGALLAGNVRCLGALNATPNAWLMPIVPHPFNDFVHMAASWIWSSGGDIMDNRGRQVLFNSPAALTGLKSFLRLVRLVPQTDYLGSDECMDALLKGQAAAVVTDARALNNTIQVHADNVENIGAASLMSIPWSGGGSLVIWRHTYGYPDRLEAAYKLVEFMVRKKTMMDLANNCYTLPSRTDALDELFPPVATLR